MLTLKESIMEEYVEPNIPLKNWYVKMCKEWLKAHGIKFHGSVSQLRDKIRSLKNDVSSPPQLIQYKKCPISVIDNFIGSLLSTVSCIMTRVVDEKVIINIEREIKMYLNNLDIFQKRMSLLQYNRKCGIKGIY